MVGSLLTDILHPFGRAGAINTTGAIYGVTVSTGTVADVFATTEKVVVTLPANVGITEIEFGLTAGILIVTTTAAPILKYQITDTGGTSLDTLVASTNLLSVASSTNMVDVTFSGRKTPSDGTYFTGVGGFDIVALIACGSTTKAAAAVKQSSYVMYSYYLK